GSLRTKFYVWVAQSARVWDAACRGNGLYRTVRGCEDAIANTRYERAARTPRAPRTYTRRRHRRAQLTCRFASGIPRISLGMTSGLRFHTIFFVNTSSVPRRRKI